MFPQKSAVLGAPFPSSACAANWTALEHRLMRLPCGFLITINHTAIDRIEQRATGGRGRIRTFVARKERQIYSLLVLATHPPVPRKQKDANCLSPQNFFRKSLRRKFPRKRKHKKDSCQKTPARLFFLQGFAPPHSPAKSWWSWRRELNPRPSDYKSDALPAELRQPRSNRVRIADGASKLQGVARIREHVGGQVCGKGISLCRTPSGLSSNSSIVYHEPPIFTPHQQGGRPWSPLAPKYAPVLKRSD